MAAPHAVTIDTPIVIKIAVNGQLKKLKLPLKDLGASVLPDKVCEISLVALVPGNSTSITPTPAFHILPFTVLCNASNNFSRILVE